MHFFAYLFAHFLNSVHVFCIFLHAVHIYLHIEHMLCIFLEYFLRVYLHIVHIYLHILHVLYLLVSRQSLFGAVIGGHTHIVEFSVFGMKNFCKGLHRPSSNHDTVTLPLLDYFHSLSR